MPTRRLSFGLSRQLWVVEAGIFLNMLGYGAVFPFEIIYLHEARGFSLGVAGLAVVSSAASPSSLPRSLGPSSIGSAPAPRRSGPAWLWPAATAASRSRRRRRWPSPPRPWPGSATAG
jgi:hypothetical protein